MSGTEDPLIVILEDGPVPRVPNFNAGRFHVISHADGAVEMRFFGDDAMKIRALAAENGVSPAEVVHGMLKQALARA